MVHPKIIQGGMGAGVSGWKLANAVSRLGGLGVVSGTAIEVIMVRKLQDGDLDGSVRRSLSKFPNQEIVKDIISEYFVEGGIKNNSYKQIPMFSLNAGYKLKALSIAASFGEVTLAKEGHNGKVGINVLEKIQLPNIYILYGAILAGVDYVIMGAGIPREIPGIVDALSLNKKSKLKVYVENATLDDQYVMELDPKDFVDVSKLTPLKRPFFLPIVSSNTLAVTMAKKSNGRVDGFVIEYPSAGGHNAPPRVKGEFNEIGEPVYGPKDYIDLEKIKDLGLPFWLGGSYGEPGGIKRALALGATGIQVGTAFAFCEESGFTEDIKKKAITLAKRGIGKVFTDVSVSPTGFPFKVLSLSGTLSEKEEYEKRVRICNLGYLRQIVKKDDGCLVYRCPAEPETQFVEKGGDIEKTKGCKCLCNALIANVGFPTRYRNGYLEAPLITVGDCFNSIKEFFKNSISETYSALDVMSKLLMES